MQAEPRGLGGVTPTLSAPRRLISTNRQRLYQGTGAMRQQSSFLRGSSRLQEVFRECTFWLRVSVCTKFRRAAEVYSQSLCPKSRLILLKCWLFLSRVFTLVKLQGPANDNLHAQICSSSHLAVCLHVPCNALAISHMGLKICSAL